MVFPVDLELLRDTAHMPALPVLQRSMRDPELRLHDFCIPVNPYFPPAELIGELRARLTDVLRYYPSDSRTVAKLISDFVSKDLHAIAPECTIASESIVAANGSTELITWINQHFVQGSLVTDIPTFGRWTDNAREQRHQLHTYARDPKNEFRLDVADFVHFARSRGARSLAICNPNNPTGALLSRCEMQALLSEARHFELVVVDESFIDFAAEEDVPSVAKDAVNHDNVIVIKSLGKNLGLHGLRCGYAVTNKTLAAELRRMLPPWNVNSLAEEMLRLMQNYQHGYDLARRRVVQDAASFARRLAAIDGVTVFPTHANFVYCHLDDDIPGVALRDVLLQQHGCFIRECSSKEGSSSQYLRIAVRPADQQALLIAALPQAIAAVRDKSSRRADVCSLAG